MKSLIGLALIAIGVLYVIGTIFNRIIWFISRGLGSGLMIGLVILGVYLLFKKDKD